MRMVHYFTDIVVRQSVPPKYFSFALCILHNETIQPMFLFRLLAGIAAYKYNIALLFM